MSESTPTGSGETPDSTWKHVSGSDAAGVPGSGAPESDSSNEAAAAPRPGTRRRRPARGQFDERDRRRKTGLILGIVTVVLVIAAAGGGWLVNHLSPATVVTQTVTPTAAPATWKLALPVIIGPYSRDANEGATPVVGADKKQTVSATYSRGGKPAVVILLSRPHADGKQFMQEANMNAVAETEPGWCGISGDNDLDACMVLRDDTAVMVVAVQDLSRTELIALAVQVADQISA